MKTSRGFTPVSINLIVVIVIIIVLTIVVTEPNEAARVETSQRNHRGLKRLSSHHAPVGVLHPSHQKETQKPSVRQHRQAPTRWSHRRAPHKRGGSRRHNWRASRLHRSPLPPFSERSLLLDHHGSPLFGSLHRYLERHLDLMEGFRKHMESQVERAGERLENQMEDIYQRPTQSHRFQSHQSAGHHPQHHNLNHHQHHRNVADRYKHPSQADAMRGHHSSHRSGKQSKYKLFKDNFDIKSKFSPDVEVLGRDFVPETGSRPTKFPFRPNVWKHFSPRNNPNCTKIHHRPLHPSQTKFTSSSHDRNTTTIHSPSRKHHKGVGMPVGPLRHILERHFMRHPSDFGLFTHPFRNHFPQEHPEGVIPATDVSRGTSTPFAGTRQKSRKTNVEEHLNQIPPVTGPDKDSIPCIKCPPDTRVEAPRGSDCVVAYPPSPLPCSHGPGSRRTMPDFRTVVRVGPSPGSLLPEGHYTMIIAISTSDDVTETTPITTCTVNYDVTVRKCPSLPEVEDADATCTAGRALGSKCSWSCRGGLLLHGSSVSKCVGHFQPHWSHSVPSCVNPPTIPRRPTPSKPPSIPPPVHPPASGKHCPSPPEVRGGHLICELPSVEIIPARDYIPKDEPASELSRGVSHRRHVRSRREPSLKSHSVGTSRLKSDSFPLESHPVGTSCKVECIEGRVLKRSDRDRAFIKCTPSLAWDQRPPSCYVKDSPVLRKGDCVDTVLTSLGPPEPSSLPLPVFFTASGDPAEVKCNLHETGEEQRFLRRCLATDYELQTSSTCQYMVLIKPNENYPHKGTGDTDPGSPVRDLKNTKFKTVSDVFGATGGISETHPVTESSTSKTEVTTLRSQERNKDKPLKFKASHISSVLAMKEPSSRLDDNPGDRHRDYDFSEVGTASLPHQTAHRRYDHLGAPIFKETEEITSAHFSKTSPVSSLTEEDFHKDESSPNKTHGIYFKSSKKPLIIDDHPEHVHFSHGTSPHESKAIDFDISGLSSHNMTGFIKTETPVMEGKLHLKIQADDCQRSDEIQETITRLLLMVEGCQILNCSTPQIICHSRLNQDEAVIEVNWTVGGLFEPLPDYYDDSHHVPSIEKNIETLLRSTTRLVASERATRSMESLGAAVDLTSVSLIRLDLLCKHPSYTFDPKSNQCIYNG